MKVKRVKRCPMEQEKIFVMCTNDKILCTNYIKDSNM